MSAEKTINTMAPLKFTVYPWESVFQNNECETIARNIMVILSRTGDIWRELTWDEYETERKKDRNFSAGEQEYFERVKDFCKSEGTARLFSPTWKTL